MMINTGVILGNVTANFKALDQHIQEGKTTPAPKNNSEIASDYVAKSKNINFLSYGNNGKV